jgi:hypothetical protein
MTVRALGSEGAVSSTSFAAVSFIPLGLLEAVVPPASAGEPARCVPSLPLSGLHRTLSFIVSLFFLIVISLRFSYTCLHFSFRILGPATFRPLTTSRLHGQQSSHQNPRLARYRTTGSDRRDCIVLETETDPNPCQSLHEHIHDKSCRTSPGRQLRYVPTKVDESL